MVSDVESQSPLISSANARVPWTEIESRLSNDDSSSFARLLHSKPFLEIWRPSDAPENATTLHKAVELGAVKCATLLLESKAGEPLGDSPDGMGNTPIFSAAKACQMACMKLLIRNNVNINARNDLGHTPLHSIAYTIASTSEESRQKELLECCDLLLGCSNIDLEAHNNSGFTVLLAAAKKLPSDQGARRKGALVPFCKRLVSRGASLDAQDARGATARELLEERNALVEVLMGEKKTPPQRPFYSLFLDTIILGSDGQQLTDLLVSQPQEEGHRIANGYIGSKTLLFYVVDKCDETAVEALLNLGSDPWREELSGELCIHRCLSRGHLGILNLLIDHMKRKRNERVLDFRGDGFNLLSKLLETDKNNKEQEIRNLSCLERMLQPDISIDINERTEGKVSQTILHVASAFNNQEALRLFLEKGAFIGSKKYLIGENRGDILPYLSTNTLSKAMDSCIAHNSKDEDTGEVENMQGQDYTLSLNYKFLVPPNLDSHGDNPLECNEIEPLMEISNSKEHRKSVQHPLIQTFLYAKWRKVLPFYVINLLLYLLFVILLTIFMYTLKDLRIMEERLKANSSAIPQDEISSQRRTVNALTGLLLIVTLYMTIREAIQLIFSVKTYYKNFENYLEWFLITMVFILCFATLDVELTRHLAAWSMIIAWYEFVLLMGRWPPLSIYVTMLRHVSFNFLKLISLYGALILAFTISFNIILQPTVYSEDEGTNFNNFWSTLPKAIVMATGEFEYSDLSSDFSRQVLFATSAVLIFLVFLFLIFLVLMNVMNGLAVCDTQQVVEEATLYSLRSRLELIFLIEELLLRTPFLKKILHKIHLITSGKQPRLLVKINKNKKRERILYGRKDEESCKMDDDTAHILRSQRLKALAEEKERRRGDPMVECRNLLQELKDIAIRNQQQSLHQQPTLSPSSSRGNLS